MANFVDLDIITDLPWLVLQPHPSGGHEVRGAFSRSADADAFKAAVKRSEGLECKVVKAVPEDYGQDRE